jgi:hypothetical protein
VVLVAGCAYPTRSTSVRLADVGNPDASRLSSYLIDSNGNEVEAVPPQVSRAAVADDAHLAEVSEGRVCVGVTMRAAVTEDRPLTDYAVKLLDAQARPEGEQVTVRDYDVVTRQPIVIAEAVSLHEYARLAVVAPVVDRFRVIERSATFCAATGAQVGRVVLALERPGDLATPNAGEVFRWELLR